VPDYRELLWKKALPRVKSPGQYVGAEWNMVRKEPRAAALRFCLAFPDTYSVGMSYGGLHLLYEILNRREDTYCERAFAPWSDMEALLRAERLPLCSLETFTPLSQFDVIGFSLQYEMGFTNVLNMLDLGGVPMFSEERTAEDPLVVAGGGCALNPEPLAEFVDLFVIGDGEERVHDLAAVCVELKQHAPGGRREMLEYLAATVPNVYIPSLYEALPDRGFSVRPLGKAPERVQAAIVQDLDGAEASRRPVLPYVEIVHDRISIEIMRGCSRGCRFCHAGMTRRPVRARSVETILDLCEAQYAATGYSEISLASLSSSDYPGLPRLMREISSRFAGRKVSATLPSLRVDEQLRTLPELIGVVRKSALTVAPEAGTERLRRVINKDVTDEDLFRGAEAAFANGWGHVKLYFMVGLPTETDEDVAAIPRLAAEVSRLRRKTGKPPALVNVSAAPFVPKAHTPFQWEAMAGLDRLKEVRDILFKNNMARTVKLRVHRPERSLLEGAFARGDRRVGKALLEAWRLGCRMDAWDEAFDDVKWSQAFDRAGLKIEECVGERRPGSSLPWSHIDPGVSEDFLRRERASALKAVMTADCRHGGCHECGLPACPHRGRPPDDGGGD
jgi:radical SAM family uncharacterized protein